jgi:hypothetical protein
MSTIINAFLAHTREASITVTRDAGIRLKQAALGEMRAARLGSDAIEAARAKSVSVCKKVVTDHYTDGFEDLENIDAAMFILAQAWGKPVETTEQPENVKVANAQLLAWRKSL